MTTGRINQVTTIPTAMRHGCVLVPEHFPTAGVRYKAFNAFI